ncbi:MAG: neuraminidase-like domain-containing protein [Methylococcaceae bacterium]
MNKITFPLKLQMKGSKVGDLHAALQSLGYLLADAEKSAKRFGATTRQALLDFQSKHGLTPSGEVDEPTAASLNQALASLGALDDVTKWLVHGHITYRSGQPAAYVQVRVYDRDVASETLLGETTTDGDGHYTLSYAESQFRRTSAERGGPELLLRIFSQDSMPLGQSKMLRNSPADTTLDAQISTEMFRVFGRVAKQDGSSGAGLKVVAVDRDLRKEEALGTTVTDAQGRYEIFYSREQFARAEKDRADLVVRVFEATVSDPNEPEAPIAESAIRFNAPAETEIDLSLPQTEAQPSEYERYVTSLSPLLEGQDVTWATLGAEDMDFLAGDTGMDRERIATLALSMQRSDETALPSLNQAGHLVDSIRIALIKPEAFYAWFRQGLPTTLAALLGQSSDALRNALRNAVAANIVPASLAESLDDIIARVQQLKAGRILRPSKANEPASLGDLFGTLPSREALSSDRQLIFAKLRNEYGNTANLWKQAEASGLSEQIPALKRTLALDELTAGHTSLMNVLQKKSDGARPESLEFLTALEPIDWIELVFEHGVPPGLGLDRDNYIAQIQGDVEKRFPMRMLSNQLEKKLLASERFPTRKVLSFFEANPDFDLKTQHVEPYLNETANRDDAPLREGLLQLQRIHILTSNARETGVLLDAGYSSATQMVKDGKPAFESKVANQLSPKRTAEVFAAAENVVTTVAVVAAAYVSPSTSGNAVNVIGAPSITKETLKKYPSLRSLFGDLDYCECRHCQSVLGPAAYLADLMHFLQRSKLTANLDGELSPANLGFLNRYLELDAEGSVLGALLQRRPDLADLEFSCENTDTKIPYIDLVLEILENAVALPMKLVVKGIDTNDINAKFAAGAVPAKIADALRETNIKVGNTLTVTAADLPSGSISYFLSWIITDGSRRWLVKCWKQLLISSTDAGVIQVLDMAGAADALENGKLNAELEDKLAQGLPIHGTPLTKEVTTNEFPRPGSAAGFWTARYTRAIAIKITMDNRIGAVESLTLDGAQLKYQQLTLRTMQIIANAFTSGANSKINPNVAELLGLPANETYLQTWNPTQNWWELSVAKTAGFVLVSARLNVTALTHQNSSIREHLESSPENRNPLAYDILASKSAVYPWALPFDLWFEETRAFLDALGIPRAQLIDLARPQLRLSEEAATLELLDLSKFEGDLLASACSSSVPWIYWGLAQKNNTVKDHSAGVVRSGDWQEVLKHLSMLLQQSGLSYREYLNFRQTRAGRSRGMLIPPNECRTSKIVLLGLDEPEFTDHLNNIHLFTRLWRKLGWSMQDLDLASAALGTAPDSLALLKHLSAGLDLPVSVLVACIDKLNTRPWTDHTKVGSPITPSLYDSVFQRQALRSLTGFDDFAIDKLGNTTLTISEHADFVAASLGIKADQVKAWITALSPGVADLVELDNLSRLYAAASLCRALRIAPEALPDIITLLGSAADPFPTLPACARARALLEFVERIDFVRKSGFDFETLSYLLRHKVLSGRGNDAGTKVEQQLTQTLTGLRAALQTGVVLGDASADNLSRQLASLGWYPSLINIAMGSDGFTHQLGASVEFSPPTAEPEIPLNLRPKFTYRKIDSKHAVLACSGSLESIDFESIDNLFPAGSVADLKKRYNNDLHDQTKVLASLLQTIQLEKLPTVTEALAHLTALPIIPGELKDRIKFEMDPASATKGKLTLTGWLSDPEKEALTKANPLLLAAVISLQAKALLLIPASSSQTSEDAEQLLREPDLEKRYRSILLRLVSRLERNLLVAQLSEALGSDQQVVDRLLGLTKINARSAKDVLTDTKFLRLDSEKQVDRKSCPHQFAVLTLLGKIATIANRLEITPEQLDWVLSQGFNVMDILTLPTSATTAPASFDGWRKLVDLFHLRDVLPDGPVRLAKIYAALKTSDFGTVRKEFADAFELSVGDVDEADGACSIKLLAFKGAAPEEDYRNPSRLLALAQLLHVIKRLGTTAIDVTRLVQPAPDQAVAQLARTLFAASIDAKEFPERLRPISNRLRNLQRDALVAYLIHRDGLADSNELFDRYLIDVEMGSCMLTSRIKQAISSVQLFVQRCLLNLERPATDNNGVPLEPGVSPVSIETRRWQWMKSYRVWEANRKIFLYPENWIEPELRDDKSEIFRAFENDLQQSEITHDAALAAFRKYLDKMGDVVNLTVVSMFEEQTSDGGSIVHVVGRDNSEPYKHYYRQWKLRSAVDFGTWTAWEEISAQLDSEHVLVFLFGGSVYLAWPTISSGQSGNLKWKIGMNLAKRSASGWTKLKKGRGDIECPMLPHTMESYTDNNGKTAFRIKYTKDERNSLAFRIMYNNLKKPDETVSIETYGPPLQDAGEELKETKQETVSGSFDSEAEKYADEHEGAGTASPTINLNLRVLDSYVYEYAGKVKQTYYKLSKYATITLTVTYKYTKPKDYDHIGGWITPAPRTVTKMGGSSKYLYNGLLGEFIELQLITWGTPDPGRRTFKTLETLTSNVLITVTVCKEGSTLSKKFNLPKDSSLTWQEDFIFELNEAPDWLPLLPSKNPNLISAGSFKLKDDDALELVPANSSALTILPAGTEHFSSGYREIQGQSYALVLGDNLQALKRTPGQYFIAQAQSEGTSSRKIWSYRDDQISLLFWKSQGDTHYRVVPLSTDGMREIKSKVTKGQLLDAVALPRSLTARPLDLDLDPRTAGTYFDSSKSVTGIGIGFEKVPTSLYNWEVFFHNPLLVATQLSQAQRFEEAQRWFHLIFDPTTNEPSSSLSESARYWRYLPFRNNEQGVSIDKLLEDLARGDTSLTEQINDWAENPFRPHLIARQRLRSYQFAVVQKYLENLIAWGDQLFRRDTIETINEAMQLYVLAAKILGKRPASSPKTEARPRSYRDIYKALDDFSNAWIPLEGAVATALSDGYPTGIDEDIRGILGNLGSLYFCIPGNEKLSEYWDTVDDRLFKIRHCMNIEGVERQLPLFEPPIDPALLVRATAAGLDLAAVLSGLDAPLPLYRFNVMLQKALELCSEVRGLGNALLSALEKKDAEGLALLRSSHEIQMLKLVRTIKVQQQEEAETNLEALRKTREITAQRYTNYQRLMGKQNVVVPAEGSVATRESSTLQLAPPNAGDSDTEGLALISAEAGHMGWLNDANNFSLIAGSLSVVAGVLHAIPESIVGPIVYQAMTGGNHLGSALNAASTAVGMLATNASFQANRSATIGGYQRRYDEWTFQSNTAAKELEQIDKQILANEIHQQIAKREITNHDQQIENAEKVDEVMREKFTNQQLYSWMVGQISSVYFRTYQMAHDIAKRAERAYRFELGLQDKYSSFIEFGYWDGLKKGLLSGERLYFDLKRMEIAYLDKNKREYEITKHVSLLQLDPLALIALRQTGLCELTIPESLFDMDCPGHFLRRIKSVSLSLPCVTGPYTGVFCTLTLLSSVVRKSPAGSDYGQPSADDPRFVFDYSRIQSVVTSSGQADSGLFETNLRDERYLPFEGAGAISTWRLELPAVEAQFDYDTISDVILHIRYTAREGGGLLRTKAAAFVKELISTAGLAGSTRLFSVRHEFATAWAKFQNEKVATDKLFELSINLLAEHFPYGSKARIAGATSMDIDILARSPDNAEPTSINVKIDDKVKGVVLFRDANLGNLLVGKLGKAPRPDQVLKLYFDTNMMADLWLAVTWNP